MDRGLIGVAQIELVINLYAIVGAIDVDQKGTGIVLRGVVAYFSGIAGQVGYDEIRRINVWTKAQCINTKLERSAAG